MNEGIYWKYRRIKESYWVRKLKNKPKCEDCTRREWNEWVRRLRRIEHKECPLLGESEELKKRCSELEELLNPNQSDNFLIMSLLDYSNAASKGISDILKKKEERRRKNIENQINECLRKKAKVDDEIQNCINRRTYMAIKKKDAYCFNSQYKWGISDCHSCMHYIVDFNVCFCNTRRVIKDTRGLCPLYKFG